MNTEYEEWQAELRGQSGSSRLRRFLSDLWRRMLGRETYTQIINRRLGL